VSADLPVALKEAHAIVEDHLTRLRDLAERTRDKSETLSAALRQAERQLDESATQHRLAVERRSFGIAGLARRHSEARDRCEKLAEEAHANEHALKQLEQLIRQIEMSSGVLTGVDEGGAADPWKLALRAQVIHGREEERLRLAREVHDGPAQVLANTLMVLETCYSAAQQLGSNQLIQMLDRTRGAVKEGMQDVRRFISDLRPGKLDELGLHAAIADYVRVYVNSYGTRVYVDAEPAPRLPREAAIVLYRIMQEALQNAHKYARNAPVTVRLVFQGRALCLSIRDEGPGFDVREVARRAGRSSWGLTSMRERAELIGADLTVTSHPGHGTDVQVILPLP
jgi:two-component system sensor histidine kinase DegS